jgi:hypothetical protein
VAINWSALGQVAVVTVVVAVIIAALMSLSNWCLTPAEGATVTTPRKAVGYALMGVMALIVLGGLYLMIPYFH